MPLVGRPSVQRRLRRRDDRSTAYCSLALDPPATAEVTLFVMRLIGSVLGFAIAMVIPAGAQPAVQARDLGLRIVVIEGEGAVNIIQQKTAVAPVVEVR